MSHDILDRLDQILTGLTDHLNGLVAALREEREAIIEFNLSQIQKIYKIKHDLLSGVQSLERERNVLTGNLAIELGIKSSPSLTYLLDKITDQDAAEIIRNKLSCLKSLAQAAQEFNDTQKQFVAHSLSHVQNSLKFIETMQGRASFAGYNKAGSMAETTLVMSTTTRTA